MLQNLIIQSNVFICESNYKSAQIIQTRSNAIIQNQSTSGNQYHTFIIHIETHNRCFYKKQNLPDLCVGDTARVTIYLELPKEADEDGKKEKERIQTYEGVIISKHLNTNQIGATITVRKVFQGVGIEKVFLTNSPWLKDIKVISRAKVRRGRRRRERRRSPPLCVNEGPWLTAQTRRRRREAGATYPPAPIFDSDLISACFAPRRDAARRSSPAASVSPSWRCDAWSSRRSL